MTDHQAPGGPAPREKGPVPLEQALWRQFSEAKTDEEYYSLWLGLQFTRLGGVQSGVLLLGPCETGPFTPAALWPPGSQEPQKLLPVAERALREGKGVLLRPDEEGSGDRSPFLMAFPVRVDGRLRGAVAARIAHRPPEALPAAMREFQWGVAWVEKRLLLEGNKDGARSRDRAALALDLVAALLQEERFASAATALATLTATRLSCDRVSVGFVQGRRVKVRALSHSAQFKEQMNLVRTIAGAMTESLDQGKPLVFPAPPEGDSLVVRAHARLAESHGDRAICTVPCLDAEGKGRAAITLERSSANPFDKGTVSLCEDVAALTVPILELLRRDDRFLVVKAAHSFGRQAGKLVGKGHLTVKVAAILLAGLAAFLSLFEGTDRVTARTAIEGRVQRAVVAPFDGFIRQAQARAGDQVTEGQVMATLDDRDLTLQRTRVESQREQFLRQYREAMAGGDRASTKVLREQVNQAEAQLALLQEQLSRTSLTAPFAGVVVSGDLTQSLAAPVQRGQVLFEVAPLEEYRVMLAVDEREISRLREGQEGKLVLNSLPYEPLAVRVDKITPVSAPEEGKNSFRVEAKLEGVSPRLRPGMEGFAKVEVGRRKLLWIWTHDIIDWVRLWVWSWWP